MKKYILLFAASALAAQLHAFCGFYVAKADATLTNKASQVIIVRDGERSAITMSSDFQGDVKDFAMVVPVPVVLKRDEIKILERNIFDRFRDYSAPRMAEYFDPEVCPRPYEEYAYGETRLESVTVSAERRSVKLSAKRDYGVKVEAQYTIEEYEIVVLSAKESGGLSRWLNDNGYKIPGKANEVLQPYILSNMKFFVVKVNMDELKKRNPYVSNGVYPLRPIQISFNSPKFMLPIRLGMANATEAQDMIVYALSRTGRIETTNYRTVNMPTNTDVPVFVANRFSEFYSKIYNKRLNEEGRNAVFLEYAWDVSPQNPVKCDPCVGTPLYLADLQQAGVQWASVGNENGKVYFTRLHVTYDREHYPQDLMFQETPNRENYQVRYVRRNPPYYREFSCDEGQRYLRRLRERRLEELANYQTLTGERASEYTTYLSEFDAQMRPMKDDSGKPKKENFFPAFGNDEGGNNGGKQLPVFLLSLCTLTAIFFALSRRRVAMA
jgi:hypothetical protein